MQTIIHKSPSLIAHKVRQFFICMGDRYVNKRRFAVGEDYDRDVFLQVYLLNKILCEDSCHLSCNREELQEKINLIILQNG